MSLPKPTISINVDPTNPGQFFACCGLLELADRLWPSSFVEGWFENNDQRFCLSGTEPLAELIQKIANTTVSLLDEDDVYSGRVTIGIGSPSFVLDWWHEAGGRADAKDLKVWAGQMQSARIAQAMQHAMRDERFGAPGFLNVGLIVYEPGDPNKKVEPYYFDARRAPNAHSRDVGFSANDLSLTTTAFPAVEFLCLVGLQRCLPVRNGHTRIYDYCTWTEPMVPALLPAAVSGNLSRGKNRGYRFENWFRTGQRKHKAFRSATPISTGD
ncbi:MAG TPA: hypothetical protein VHR66_24940 [Gemmataceae bacterium]|jgi:hypothetical protein|nr:hypothetical protein [Gemmataceae bacterium]